MRFETATPQSLINHSSTVPPRSSGDMSRVFLASFFPSESYGDNVSTLCYYCEFNDCSKSLFREDSSTGKFKYQSKRYGFLKKSITFIIFRGGGGVQIS